jgi:beta-N-acetylhexosaminidase
LAPPLAVVFGCEGTALTPDERLFFREADPAGFILFARNVSHPDQVRTLVAALRDTVGRTDAPVLIDQEGGRVARLAPPYWSALPPARRFGELARRDLRRAREAARTAGALIAAELSALGITVDCAPVADVPVPGAHDVVGDRAYGDTPDVVGALAGAVAEGLLSGGVIPVVKHIPGHGRAWVDSHEQLPVVTAPLATLEKTDFAPFRALRRCPWAMTAHVVYDALDAERPATLSPVVIGEVIRGHIGFQGVLISDDLSMKALTGSFEWRAAAALAAGCDLVLHCNGRLGEMIAVAKGASPLSAHALARLKAAEAQRVARRAEGPLGTAAELGIGMNALLEGGREKKAKAR